MNEPKDIERRINDEPAKAPPERKKTPEELLREKEAEYARRQLNRGYCGEDNSYSKRD